jgi:hypothetical protein
MPFIAKLQSHELAQIGLLGASRHFVLVAHPTCPGEPRRCSMLRRIGVPQPMNCRVIGISISRGMEYVIAGDHSLELQPSLNDDAMAFAQLST